MSWDELLAAYLEHLASLGRARSTRAQAARYLRRFGEACRSLGVEEPAGVAPGHVARHRQELAWLPGRRGLLSAHTVVGRLACVRGLFRWAVVTHRLLVDPCRHLVLRRAPRTLARILTVEQVEALLATPDPATPYGLRDRAMLEVLYGTGARRPECLGLDLCDVELSARILHVREGKGRKDRKLAVGERLAEALEAYLRDGRPALAPRPSEPALFLSRYGRRLSTNSVDALFRRHAAASGVGRPLSPHLLRYAFATHMLEGGADLAHVSAMLGHANLDTTERYTLLRPLAVALEHERTHPRARRRRPSSPS